MKPLLTPHLTDPNPEFNALVRKTAPGMAHFAGTGPEGKFCKDCDRWQVVNKKYRCTRFKLDGPPINGSLEACKYFEQKAHPK